MSGSALQVVYSFPGRLGVTGIGTTAWYQVQELARAGARVRAYCGTCERPLEGVEVVETMRWLGVRVPYRVFGDDRAWAIHDAITARAVMRLEAADIVHAWPLGARRTLRAARMREIPSFLERPNTHTGFAYDVVAKETKRLGLELTRNHSHAPNPARLAREEAEYEAADRLLCPSDFVAKTFLERGFAAAKIARHRYGFDPARFKPPAREGDGVFRVLFAGSCEPRKGLHFALEAWKRSGAGERGGEFWIAGRFVAGYRERIAGLMEQPGVKELGFQSDMGAVMARCDAMVLPSIEEGSALVTYEARAAGCVLLVSDAAGAPCEHLETGLIHAAGDVQGLCEHIVMLERDRGRLARLRERSLSGVHELTWAAAAQRLLDVYREAYSAAERLDPDRDEVGAGSP